MTSSVYSRQDLSRYIAHIIHKTQLTINDAITTLKMNSNSISMGLVEHG